MEQTTDTLLLVRPFLFRKNEETAVNNYFQTDLSASQQPIQAQKEFDEFVQTLSNEGINTIVLQDQGLYDTPDSIFPNNCISFHHHTAVCYPMFAENRRRERQLDYFRPLQEQGITFDNIIDYTGYEGQNRFLEGTGCLILDRVNHIAYCSLSPRADEDIVRQFCADLNFELFIFEAYQTVGGQRQPIYHTNVLMSIGTRFAILCTDSIDNINQRTKLLQRLHESGKTVVEISEEQMNTFAGNILEVKTTAGHPCIVMSSSAYNSFTAQQRSLLSTWGKLIHSPLDIIETAGGGSARCMLAEVFY